MTTTKIHNIPKHVAVIMDGNGRWAQKRGLERTQGHRAGVESIHAIVEAALKYGVEVLTLFAFSSENWRRPESEVTQLFELYYETLVDVLPKLYKNEIKLRIAGNLTNIPQKLQEYLAVAEEETNKNQKMTIVIALNYGGRWDIVQAAQKLLNRYHQASFIPQLTEEEFNSVLSLADLPEPDLFIRTSGEQRISNFLLWQLAYTELYFTPVLWPDFRETEFADALQFFMTRQRRFGATSCVVETALNQEKG